MNKMPMTLLAGAMAMSIGAFAAEQAKQPPPVTSKNCSKLSGQEKDKCIQATPAGPVDMQSGTQRKGKSEIAKRRDNEKEANQATGNAPAQNNDAVGKPQERAATGEAQTGAKTAKKKPSEKALPEQAKGSVGNPEGRSATGEAQTGQESGQNSANKTQ